MNPLILVLIGIALVFSGCGGSSGDGSMTTVGEFDFAGDPTEINPVALARTAKEQSETATSFRGDMEMRMTGLPEVGEFTMQMSLEAAANGDVAAVSEWVEDTRDGLGFGGSNDVRSEIRFVDGFVYVSFPQEMMEEIADTPWASFDIDELTDVDLDNLGNFDTNTLLNYLVGIDDEAIVTLGEDVNGIPTTRISGTYTMAELLDPLPEDQRQAMMDSQQFFSGMANNDMNDLFKAFEKIPIQLDVWIDQNNYILRELIVIDQWYEFIVAIDPSAEDSKEEIDDLVQIIDMYFYDYGAPITITAPPEQDVTHIQGSFAESLL
ncbi:hypothetical protein [Candidatus Poriferisocius sp.]|uniref:hypothetical protein n=1 Tax=Candidatus Poriferisocius sp. TaxID=3101276 RepID=UPI003B02A872